MNMLNNFKRYHIQVLKRAWKDSHNSIPRILQANGFPEHGMIIIYCLVFLVSAFVHYLREQNPNYLKGTIESGLYGIAICALVFLILFLINLLIAPSKIDLEKNQKIKELNKLLIKKQDHTKTYQALLSLHENGEKIRKGDFGLAPITQMAAWVKEGIKLMTDLNLPLSEIREFEKPYGASKTDHLQRMDTHLYYLDSYIRRYMDKSEEH